MGDLACTITSVDDVSAATNHPAVQFPEGSTSAMESLRPSELSVDMIEEELSFLPVPALCRFRSVCTKWKELFLEKSFLDKWDKNGGKREYLFVTRYLSARDDGQSFVDDEYRRATCFLDLHERRWYPIPSTVSLLPTPSDDRKLRLLAMDDGLVCELSKVKREYKLVMLDPVAKTRRQLPSSTPNGRPVCCEFGGDNNLNIDDMPLIVTHVDKADRSFKVFLMNRDCTYARHPARHIEFFVSESSTDAWRSLDTPPGTLQDRVRESLGVLLEESVVFFRGNLYAVVRPHFRFDDTIIASYNLERNFWSEVLVIGVDLVKYPERPQLIVSGNRMSLAIWSHPVYTSRTNDSYFEIREIFVDVSQSRMLWRIPCLQLRQMFGESYYYARFYAIQYGFPLHSNSLVVLTRRSGRLFTFDLTSRAVSALPAHPLLLSERDAMELQCNQHLFYHHRARLSNLSLRNILSVRQPS